ncbi:hypothetical protein KM176_14430 [Pseudooceanicola sp. CBS1P-1]|uniref:RcnB family protein n=1 Tax=Pseudooceanicola albus TaxID=2692189 RepID=A0A6L7G2P8_9RHOB|nr:MULTISPECIES: hypothetical protein [Pseudooceanicola]MBT9385063.1 hypothetical protein [Pseudooceanicola endophyticus]MXN18644.1 hypothetical protein [Pseudooceanicola albus]
MNKTFALAVTALLAFGPVSGAFAQTQGNMQQQQDCTSKSGCKDQKSTQQKQHSTAPATSTTPKASSHQTATKQQPAAQSSSTAKAATSKAKAPKVGESGKSGHKFTPAANSKLGKAPSGQEYRVVNDYVVLITKTTQAIAKVVGPAANYK